MCGIVGIVGHQHVNQSLFDALTVLQHRGQDAAGMATCNGQHLHLRKGKGLVRDVFCSTQRMQEMEGHMGIGHLRYPTAGTDNPDEAQPFYVNSPYGIMLVHNGNLTNAEQLRDELVNHELRHLSTQSDSEVLLNIFASELQKIGKAKFDEKDIFAAVSAVHRRCRGAYAVIALIAGFGVVCFRDPHGIRPLVYGQAATQNGIEYMIASESVALDMLGFQRIDDVAPGEALVITSDHHVFKQQCAEHTQLNPCLFEYIYLARPDSVIDKISVYKVRLRLGERLAEKILREFPDHDIDVVMPIPDTSRTAASTLAMRLGIKFREGFVKNRYIGRTFIMPGQHQRRKSIRQKLNTIPLEFQGKNVLLVDDSIVRGNTSIEIVQMARNAGAKKVYFASAAPEIRYPNVYGIDMPMARELIAHNRDVQQMAIALNADWLIFQDLKDLIDAALEGNSNIQRFEDSVFTGDYLTGDVTEKYLSDLEQARYSKTRRHED